MVVIFAAFISVIVSLRDTIPIPINSGLLFGVSQYLSFGTQVHGWGLQYCKFLDLLTYIASRIVQKLMPRAFI